jgi:hypothetical protein
MQSTSINLLTRDGALSVTFAPALTSHQYDQLLREIKNDGDTRAELAILLKSLGREWNCRVTVD